MNQSLVPTMDSVGSPDKSHNNDGDNCTTLYFPLFAILPGEEQQVLGTVGLFLEKSWWLHFHRLLAWCDSLYKLIENRPELSDATEVRLVLRAYPVESLREVPGTGRVMLLVDPDDPNDKFRVPLANFDSEMKRFETDQCILSLLQREVENVGEGRYLLQFGYDQLLLPEEVEGELLIIEGQLVWKLRSPWATFREILADIVTTYLKSRGVKTGQLEFKFKREIQFRHVDDDLDENEGDESKTTKDCTADDNLGSP